MKKYSDIVRGNNQPLLCTYLEGKIIPNDNNIILYSPRSELSGSVVCHLGEVHKDKVDILQRIYVK